MELGLSGSEGKSAPSLAPRLDVTTIEETETARCGSARLLTPSNISVHVHLYGVIAGGAGTSVILVDPFGACRPDTRITV